MYLISTAFKQDRTIEAKTCTSPVTTTFGIQSLVIAESSDLGLTGANMNDFVNVHAFPTSPRFFVLDNILYMELGVYMERGAQSVWRDAAVEISGHAIHSGKDIVSPSMPQRTSNNIEPMGETLRQQETLGEGQQIRNMRMVCFSGKVAVHGVQITCLLGHNDAGKTPLMSMLTRMIHATVGTRS
ncbi:hypothetical protein AaE_012481 [Aphanomyces astaci]|uniref:ABC transporter domain-containing protein n=1 Tax=Aphanomyces astaci TaxID=112090 RepID=A0A6A4ZFZ2_APHAT|nr:hypothetical protein AaE_012481 [Aphanomyces astaci]